MRTALNRNQPLLNVQSSIVDRPIDNCLSVHTHKLSIHYQFTIPLLPDWGVQVKKSRQPSQSSQFSTTVRGPVSTSAKIQFVVFLLLLFLLLSARFFVTAREILRVCFQWFISSLGEQKVQAAGRRGKLPEISCHFPVLQVCSRCGHAGLRLAANVPR